MGNAAQCHRGQGTGPRSQSKVTEELQGGAVVGIDEGDRGARDFVRDPSTPQLLSPPIWASLSLCPTHPTGLALSKPRPTPGSGWSHFCVRAAPYSGLQVPCPAGLPPLPPPPSPRHNGVASTPGRPPRPETPSAETPQAGLPERPASPAHLFTPAALPGPQAAVSSPSRLPLFDLGPSHPS